jgi:hypothetical protein
MPKYRVVVELSLSIALRVDAADEEEALEYAKSLEGGELLQKGDIGHEEIQVWEATEEP